MRYDELTAHLSSEQALADGRRIAALMKERGRLALGSSCLAGRGARARRTGTSAARRPGDAGPGARRARSAGARGRDRRARDRRRADHRRGRRSPQGDHRDPRWHGRRRGRALRRRSAAHLPALLRRPALEVRSARRHAQRGRRIQGAGARRRGRGRLAQAALRVRRPPRAARAAGGARPHHTSAATVAVLPNRRSAGSTPTTCASTPCRRRGRAARQQTESAVRITHIPTNTVVVCMDRIATEPRHAMRVLRCGSTRSSARPRRTRRDAQDAGRHRQRAHPHLAAEPRDRSPVEQNFRSSTSWPASSRRCSGAEVLDREADSRAERCTTPSSPPRPARRGPPAMLARAGVLDAQGDPQPPGGRAAGGPRARARSAGFVPATRSAGERRRCGARAHLARAPRQTRALGLHHGPARVLQPVLRVDRGADPAPGDGADRRSGARAPATGRAHRGLRHQGGCLWYAGARITGARPGGRDPRAALECAGATRRAWGLW